MIRPSGVWLAGRPRGCRADLRLGRFPPSAVAHLPDSPREVEVVMQGARPCPAWPGPAPVWNQPYRMALTHRNKLSRSLLCQFLPISLLRCPYCWAGSWPSAPILSRRRRQRRPSWSAFPARMRMSWSRRRARRPTSPANSIAWARGRSVTKNARPLGLPPAQQNHWQEKNKFAT